MSLRHILNNPTPVPARGKLALRGSPLTTREGEVLTLAAQGFANSEIAGKLFICVKTVEKHRDSGTGKIGARCAAHIVHWAILTGKIKPGECNAQLQGI